jgi:hypothetical protein
VLFFFNPGSRLTRRSRGSRTRFNCRPRTFSQWALPKSRSCSQILGLMVRIREQASDFLAYAISSPRPGVPPSCACPYPAHVRRCPPSCAAPRPACPYPAPGLRCPRPALPPSCATHILPGASAASLPGPATMHPVPDKTPWRARGNCPDAGVE